MQFEQAVIAFLVEVKKLTCIRECLLKVGAWIKEPETGGASLHDNYRVVTLTLQ